MQEHVGTDRKDGTEIGTTGPSWLSTVGRSTVGSSAVGAARAPRLFGLPGRYIRGMYAIVVIRYRVPIEVIEANTEDHRAYLRTLAAAGTLLVSGPMVPRTGGVLVLRVADGEGAAAALDRVRDGDPFWQRGLANYELLQWAPTIGRETLDAIGAA